jgi:hypothetical protein
MTRSKLFIAPMLLALCAISPVAFAADNTNTGQALTDPNAPKATKEERAAARKARSAAGKDTAKGDLANPTNTETGQPLKSAGMPKATKEEKDAARKARSAAGKDQVKEDLANPTNPETGLKLKK